MTDPDPTSSPAEPAPGHYGPGYGERPATSTPQPPADLEQATEAPAGLEPRDALPEPDDFDDISPASGR